MFGQKAALRMMDGSPFGQYIPMEQLDEFRDLLTLLRVARDRLGSLLDRHLAPDPHSTEGR